MKLVYDESRLQQFCHQRGIAKLELFGSALREDFRADSDVDLLCTLSAEEDKRCGLLGWVDLQLGLQDIFGRHVDLVSRSAIERSRNEYRKRAILKNLQSLYGEG
jgi:predicted nucleotidyltransferase